VNAFFSNSLDFTRTSVEQVARNGGEKSEELNPKAAR
jgi:hypothetical protein